MPNLMKPKIGETYKWAGKTWRVVEVCETDAKVENIVRPTDTARMPFTQFRPMAVDHDPVDDVTVCDSGV